MLNFNKLQAALKGQSTIRWFKKDGFNYIMTGYFIIKTWKEIEGSALIHLLKTFKSIPSEGAGLEWKDGEIRELSEQDVNNSSNLISMKDCIEIEYTNLVQEDGRKVLNIFKGADYIFIDRTYMSLVTLTKEVTALGKSRVSPVFFKNETDETLMVMPFRAEKSKYLV